MTEKIAAVLPIVASAGVFAERTSPAAYYVGLAAYIIGGLLLTGAIVVGVVALIKKRNTPAAYSLEGPELPSDHVHGLTGSDD